MKRWHPRPPRALWLLLCVSLTRCGDSPAPPAEEKKADKVVTAKAAEAPATAPGPPYSYSPMGKRDPFRSYLVDLTEQRQVQQVSTRKKEETEAYELEQYRLTGLITGTSQPKAMVEDPSGRGHVVRIGSHLGKNGGRLVRISNVAIVVLEEARDPTGKRMRVPITIKLPRVEFEPFEP